MAERPNNRRHETNPEYEFERQLRGYLEHVQPPLYAALEEEYRASRGWLVCGPATMALSRLMHEQTGIPIGMERGDEHLELTVGFFDPARSNHQPSDHTHLRYYTGRGDVYFIDMIYNRLWPGAGVNQDATIIERFGVHDIDAQLQERFSLYPFAHFPVVRPRLAPFDPWGFGDFSPRALDDFVHAFNQPDITENELTAKSGATYDISFFWGERLQRVIANTRRAL